MWPIGSAAHMSVFDGIEMDVIDVSLEIQVTADEVFPEAALPDSTLSLLDPACGTPFAARNPGREPRLDVMPARRKIAVTGGKCPDAMKMVREDNDCVDGEWPTSAGIDERHPQFLDMLG